MIFLYKAKLQKGAHHNLMLIIIILFLSTCFTGPPSSPPIRDEDIRLDRFTISWTIVSDVNNVCGPVMYNVTLVDDGVTNTTSMTNITYSGLNHTTNYTVVVIPYNNAGLGTPANITGTTLIPSGQNICICIQLFCGYISTYIHSST